MAAAKGSDGHPAGEDDRREGTVVQVTGRTGAFVSFGGEAVACSLRKTLFRDLGGFRGALAVGDRVVVNGVTGAGPVIEEIRPRKGWLSRRQGRTGAEQVLVANVDQAIILASLREPEFRPRIVDRILVAAERGGFAAVIVLTKADLVPDRTVFSASVRAWEALGYPVVFTSLVTGEGIERIRGLLQRRTSVVSGQSGVGKTSLLNAVQPGLGLRIGEVAGPWSKGRHTTTSAVWIPLEEGGAVVDTPGIRSFAIAGLEPSDLGLCFREFIPWIDSCRFRGCTHAHEPGCAVKDALRQGRIDPGRYESYLRILGGVEDED